MPSRTTASPPPSRPATHALAPAVRAQALEANPALAGIPSGHSRRLDESAAGVVNARAGIGRLSIENVAAELLERHGMI